MRSRDEELKLGEFQTNETIELFDEVSLCL